MPKLPERYLNAAVIWDDFCKELGIDPEHCKKITIEIAYGQPILVFPEMLIRHDAKVFNQLKKQEEAYISTDEVGSPFNDFLPRCANCYKQLGDDFIQNHKNGESENFCSTKCAEEYAAGLKRNSIKGGDYAETLGLLKIRDASQVVCFSGMPEAGCSALDCPPP